MMNKIGIYPGTFDPMTAGHMDIIKRSLKIVDNLVIAVAKNLSKDSLFNVDERIDIINNDILDCYNDFKFNKPIKVFGNLPYNISTKILTSFIKIENLRLKSILI